MTMVVFGEAAHPLEDPTPNQNTGTDSLPDSGQKDVSKVTTSHLRAEFTNRKRDGPLDIIAAMKAVCQAIFNANSHTEFRELIGSDNFTNMAEFPSTPSEFNRFFDQEVDNRHGSRKILVGFRIDSG